jgi:hypothetical protein
MSHIETVHYVTETTIRRVRPNSNNVKGEALCGNGSVEGLVTNEKYRVNCLACINMLTSWGAPDE